MVAYMLSLRVLITLDTNVLYQAVRSKSGASHAILQEVRGGKIQMALSVPLFLEYEDVLTQKKSIQDLGLTLNDNEKILRFIAYIGKTFNIYYLFRPNLRDEKDNMVFELAITSQSNYLVTNNVKDFRNAEIKIDQTFVVTPSDFLKKWRKKDV